MKKYITASLLILFTLALVVCGLFLPSVLMDRQQQSLFSRTETIHLPTAADSEDQTTELTQRAFFAMALSYGMLDIYPYWYSYDSNSQQPSTEYLIQTAHQQIKQLCELGVLPEVFADTSYTWENVEYGTTWSPELYNYLDWEPYGFEYENYFDESSQGNYSGWIVYAGNSNLNINVVINAACGQIIKLTAAWQDESGAASDTISGAISGTASGAASDSNSKSGSGSDEKTTPLSSAQIQKKYLEYLNLTDIAQISQESTSSLYHFPDYSSKLVVNLCHYQDEVNYQISLLEKERAESNDADFTDISIGENADSGEFNYHTLEIFFIYD